MCKNKVFQYLSSANSVPVNFLSLFYSDTKVLRALQLQRLVALHSLLIFIFFMPAAVSAEKWQSRQSILETVNQFINSKIAKEDVEFKINSIDSRLRLSQCDISLIAFLPEHSRLDGKSTIGVRCPGKKPWTMYVPTQISRFGTVLVPTQPLFRGHQIVASDLTTTRMKISSSNGKYLTNPSFAVGKILKRNIYPNKPLLARWLQSPKLVKRGQEVILMAISSSIQVRMSGKALADGAKGDLIQVRNNTSRRIVEGKVTSTGVVQVKM